MKTVTLILVVFCSVAYVESGLLSTLTGKSNSKKVNLNKEVTSEQAFQNQFEISLDPELEAKLMKEKLYRKGAFEATEEHLLEMLGDKVEDYVPEAITFLEKNFPSIEKEENFHAQVERRAKNAVKTLEALRVLEVGHDCEAIDYMFMDRIEKKFVLMFLELNPGPLYQATDRILNFFKEKCPEMREKADQLRSYKNLRDY